MPYSLNLYSDLCQLFLKKKYKWMNVYMILVLGILQINEKPLFLFSGLSNLLPIIYVFLIFFFLLFWIRMQTYKNHQIFFSLFFFQRSANCNQLVLESSLKIITLRVKPTFFTEL